MMQRSLPGTRSDRKNDADFEIFWGACPRRIGKLDARKQYDRARKLASAQGLLDAMHRFADENRATERKFICHPSTWLCAGRWLDESDTPPDKTSGVVNGQPMHIWILWVRAWRDGSKYWPEHIVGPKPGQKECRVPDALLTKTEIAAK